MTDVGSRELNKQRTREALVEAAIEILAAKGASGLTAARVAKAAHVSRRTFFNYFPTIEALLTAITEGVTTATVEAMLTRPAEESLLDTLRASLSELLDSPAFARVELLARLALEDPALHRLMLSIADSQTQALEEGLRRRLGEHADPAYVAALASASAAIFGRMAHLAAAEAGTDAEHPREIHREWVRRAFEHLFAGFDPAGALIKH